MWLKNKQIKKISKSDELLRDFLLGPEPEQQCGEKVSLSPQLHLCCFRVSVAMCNFHCQFSTCCLWPSLMEVLLTEASFMSLSKQLLSSQKQAFWIPLLNISPRTGPRKNFFFALKECLERVCIGFHFLVFIQFFVCQPTLYPPEFSFSVQSLCVFVSLRWNFDALMERRVLPVQGVWEGPHTHTLKHTHLYTLRMPSTQQL